MGKAPRKQLATKSARRPAQPSHRHGAVIDRMRARIQEETVRFVGLIQSRIQDETIQFIRRIEGISRCFLQEFQMPSSDGWFWFYPLYYIVFRVLRRRAVCVLWQQPWQWWQWQRQWFVYIEKMFFNDFPISADQATSPGVAVGRQWMRRFLLGMQHLLTH